MIEKVDKFT